jgi:GNAT superfamily N-acetyltransferase
MAEFLIREASDDDGPILARLMAEARPEEGEALGPPDAAALERPASFFREAGGRLWVVVREDAAAGSFGLLARGRPKEFELSMICLQPGARGQGLATALLAGANAFALASGGERLSVWVDVRFEDLHRFCERHGFVREPGIRARHDGSEALECRFSRAVQ